MANLVERNQSNKDRTRRAELRGKQIMNRINSFELMVLNCDSEVDKIHHT
jgi:hypothetical protein